MPTPPRPDAAGDTSPEGAGDTSIHGEVRRALIAVLLARTGVNAGVRVVLPFLPAIARGLDTSLTVVGGLVALRSLVGLGAPLLSDLTQRVGRRAVMLGGLVVTGIGSAVIGLAPGVAVAAVGFVLVGIGKPAFDVPMQGWFGARVAYGQRGRVLGLTELTWAGGLLASVPLSGWLIARTSWRAQFAVVVGLVLVGLVAVTALMRPDRPARHIRRPLVLTRPRAAILVVVLLFGFAAEGLFVVYGAWLEADLGFDVTAIGVFTLVVVAAELAGEGAVAAVGGRWGLRRSVQVALLVSAGAYLLLPLVGGSVAGAVLVVVAWFVSYEITIVSTIPFVTELGGTGRDRLIGLAVAALAAARACGALVLPAVFARGGIAAAGVLAAGCALVAAVVLTALVPEPDET